MHLVVNPYLYQYILHSLRQEQTVTSSNYNTTVKNFRLNWVWKTHYEEPIGAKLEKYAYIGW